MKLEFSFPTFSKALASRIKSHNATTAFIIGITGPWGSGKTTLMNATISELGDKNIHFIFNAWAHSKQDAVWRAFFISIVSILRKELENNQAIKQEKTVKEIDKIDKLLTESEQALYTAFTRELPGEIELDTGNLAKNSVKLALKFVPWGDTISSITTLFGKKEAKFASDGSTSESESNSLSTDDIDNLWGVFKRSVTKQHIAKIESLEQFRDKTREVLEHFTSQERKLIIGIDDVDRCLPEQGLEVFEAIKLFLDLPNTVFLIAMDQEVLQHALDLRYKQENSRRITAELYAEKMIDVTFSIPSPTATSFSKFLDSLPLSGILKENFALISSGLPMNPRTWTRFAHRIALRGEIIKDLHNDSGTPLIYVTAQKEFLKLEILWHCWPQFMRKVDSLENYLRLERIVIDAEVNSSDFLSKINQKQNIESIISERTTDSLYNLGFISGSLNDLKLIRFLAIEPHLSEKSQQHDYLESLFSLDR